MNNAQTLYIMYVVSGKLIKSGNIRLLVQDLHDTSCIDFILSESNTSQMPVGILIKTH